jgi:bifunctional lysine-specific demethylase and histidyl-hydroxylase NO66
MIGDPLDWLLGRKDAARFHAEVYEQAAVHVHARKAGLDPARFAPILTIGDVDRLVTTTDLRQDDLVLADAAVEGGIPHSDYVDSGGFIDRGAVARKHREGATIILNQAHRFLSGLGELCQAIEGEFSCHVQTNLYLTPAGAQGFPTHFDSHDVFVLQVAGQKQWQLYGTPLANPYRGERFQRHSHEAGDLVASFCLEPGDVAYVPRGMMHDALGAGEGASLHITVGLIVKSWADLVLEAVAEVALREPAFRRALPAGFARDSFDRSGARATLAKLGAALAAEMRLDPALDLMADEFVRTRPAFAPGAVIAATRPLDAAQAFVASPHCQYRREQEAGGQRNIRILAPGGELWFTPESGAALDRALSGTPFTADDLAFDHAAALVRRLFDYGLVVRA